MSNTQDKIIAFTNGLQQTPEKAIKFAMFNSVKMLTLLDDIKRYLIQEFKGRQTLRFTSQDLRTFIIALERTQAIINKKLSFSDLKVQTLKAFRARQKKKPESKVIDQELLRSVAKNTRNLIKLALEMQHLRGWFNHYAHLTYMIECDYEYAKSEDDRALSNAITETINNILNE